MISNFFLQLLICIEKLNLQTECYTTGGNSHQRRFDSEERIEAVCVKECLEQVIEAIKAVHPYEQTVIDIYPIYQLGIKGQA